MTHSVSGDTRQRWTWSKEGVLEGNWIHWGYWEVATAWRQQALEACIHQVRDALFCMGENLVGGNCAAHFCGPVDPLMIVSQVPMGGGQARAVVAQSIGNIGKRPPPP